MAIIRVAWRDKGGPVVEPPNLRRRLVRIDGVASGKLKPRQRSENAERARGDMSGLGQFSK
jgi:hypothetical protein